ncbi:MAG: MFS transporter [Paludibacteraceae bacterium]|nr:MFS transporter [Paludibacteraceae bacterium]
MSSANSVFSAKGKTPAVAFVMLVTFYFSIAFTTGLNDPFSKVIQSQFDLSVFESQFGNFAFFLSYLLMGIPASRVVGRLGYKKGAQTALCGMLMGVGMVLAGGNLHMIWLYLLGMFVLGCAITVLQVVVNPLIIAIGPRQGANRRMNIGGAASSIGATFAPLVVGFIIGNVAVDSLGVHDVNPLLYVLMGFYMALFLVLCFTRIPEPDIRETMNRKSEWRRLMQPSFVMGLVAIFLYVGFEVTTANLTNLFLLNELKMDPAVAGAIVGSYWLLMLFGRLVGAAVGTMIQSRGQLLIVSSLALLLYVLAVTLPLDITIRMPAVSSNLSFVQADVPLSILLLVLTGFCNSVMWVCIFILSTSGLGKSTNLASGIFMMMVCGGGIIPVIQGRLVDVLDGYQHSYVVGIFCVAFILIYALLSKKDED